MKKEIWKPIPNFEDIYEVSSYGNVRSLDRIVYIKNRGSSFRKTFICGRKMKTADNGKGYKFLYLKKDGKSVRMYVHRLVAMVFVPKIHGKQFVNHKDGNKSNNHFSNLEWCTVAENNKHKMEIMQHFTSTKGKPNLKNRKKVGVYVDGVQINVFGSLYEASQKLHLNYSNLSSICHGKRKSNLTVKYL